MPRRSLSRRTALGVAGGAAVAAGAGLTGCSADSTVDALKAPTPGTPTPPDNPDVDLVESVVAAMRAADAGAPPAFARLHAAQATALGRSAPTASPSALPTAGWQQRQRALPATLTQAALSATDADLVRLLASAAAGQRQLLQARGLR